MYLNDTPTSITNYLKKKIHYKCKIFKKMIYEFQITAALIHADEIPPEKQKERMIFN
jgi:hypothetical protein